MSVNFFDPTQPNISCYLRGTLISDRKAATVTDNDNYCILLHSPTTDTVQNWQKQPRTTGATWGGLQVAMHSQQENVAIANALQLEVARRSASPYPPKPRFKSNNPIRSVFTADTLRYAVTLVFDLVILTFDL